MRKSVVCGPVFVVALAVSAAAQGVAPADPVTQNVAVVSTSQAGRLQFAASAEQVPAAPRPASAMKKPGGLKRWVDLQTATLAARSRENQAGPDAPKLVGLQHQQIFKARFNADSSAKFGVGFAAQTGSSFTSGWDNTGIGANARTSNLTVRQLFASAKPVRSLDLQYGGIGIARGESTEITTFDNDGAMVGSRATVKNPKAFFNEISLTQGYLGDASLPSFFDRAHRLDEVNYRQLLVARDVTKRVKTAFDVTSLDGKRSYHEGVKVRLAGSHVLDSVRLEAYQRAADDASGYALSLERGVGRVLFGGGWADIDKRFTTLGGDRYGRGDRLFTTVTAPVFGSVTVSGFYGYAIDRDVKQRSRGDLVLTYDVLKALRARKVL